MVDHAERPNDPPTQGGSWTSSRRLARVRRAPSGDLVVRTIDGYLRHRTGRSAAVVSHYGFLAVFPMIAVFTTILGFVLQNRPNLQAKIVDSALNQIPIVGPQLGSDPSKLRGSVLILVFGLLTSLWAALRAFVAFQGSLDDIAEIPAHRRSNVAVIRLHALIGFGVIGGAQIGTAILTAIVGAARLPGVSKALLVVATVAVNIAVLALCYRWLCSQRRPWALVAPGATVCGVIFAGLQLLGTVIVGRAIANASAVYGAFATVIGLLTWIGLHSTVALGGAELNQALIARRADALQPPTAT